MDARAAFKFGFISRCIEQGLTTIDEIQPLLKTALLPGLFAAEGIGGALEKGWDVLKGTSEIGAAGLLAAPPIAGYAAGHLLGNATNTDADRFDTDDAKQQELIDEYRRRTLQLRNEGMVMPKPKRRGLLG